MFDRHKPTVKAQSTAGEVTIRAHQSSAALKPHDVDRNNEWTEYDSERSSALIPGIITAVFRDRNTNAVSKFSSIATKKFIHVTGEVQRNERA